MQNNETDYESHDNLNNGHEELSIEKKLGDLMLRGWIMLTDVCPVESKININPSLRSAFNEKPEWAEILCWL
jgi:hypothetical protein